MQPQALGNACMQRGDGHAGAHPARADDPNGFLVILSFLPRSPLRRRFAARRPFIASAVLQRAAGRMPATSRHGLDHAHAHRTLQVQGLRKAYGSRTAVESVSFQVRPGQVLGLLGPNGAGKSTTVGMICRADHTGRRRDPVARRAQPGER